MSTVLSNGVKIPDTGSTNWDVDVNNNFSLLNTAIGDISGKANSSDLSTVATTGSYNDLADKPTIPTTVAELTDASDYAKSASLAKVATSGSYEDLSNKPTNTVTTDTEQTITGAKDFTTIPTIDGDNTLCGADVLTLEEIEASTSFNDTDVASASAVKGAQNNICINMGLSATDYFNYGYTVEKAGMYEIHFSANSKYAVDEQEYLSLIIYLNGNVIANSVQSNGSSGVYVHVMAVSHCNVNDVISVSSNAITDYPFSHLIIKKLYE